MNSSSIETAQCYFHARNRRTLLVLAGVTTLTLLATNLVEFNWLKAFEVIPKVVTDRAEPVAQCAHHSFTGFLALLFATFGFLTRVFMETIDEVSASAVEGLRATGASYGAIVTQAVLPSALPQMVSWELFVIEVNIRNATLVGLLTGSASSSRCLSRTCSTRAQP